MANSKISLELPAVEAFVEKYKKTFTSKSLSIHSSLSDQELKLKIDGFIRFEVTGKNLFIQISGSVVVDKMTYVGFYKDGKMTVELIETPVWSWCNDIFIWRNRKIGVTHGKKYIDVNLVADINFRFPYRPENPAYIETSPISNIFFNPFCDCFHFSGIYPTSNGHILNILGNIDGSFIVVTPLCLEITKLETSHYPIGKFWEIIANKGVFEENEMILGLPPTSDDEISEVRPKRKNEIDDAESTSKKQKESESIEPIENGRTKQKRVSNRGELIEVLKQINEDNLSRKQLAQICCHDLAISKTSTLDRDDFIYVIRCLKKIHLDGYSRHEYSALRHPRIQCLLSQWQFNR